MNSSSHRRDELEEASPLLGQDAAGWERHASQIATYTGFAWRSVIVGLAIGVLVCLTNIHFGLQTGYINIMGMPSALIGFGVFQLLQKHLELSFCPAENTLIQTVASSVGAMPAAAGLVGMIPSLEYLVPLSNGSYARLGLVRLCIWSFGISVFGLVFAMILRNRIILKENLRFPTGTATALTINVLHQDNSIADLEFAVPSATVLEERIETSDAESEHLPTTSPKVGLREIGVAMVLSGSYVCSSKSCFYSN
jgi:uncharacterized oligopeptide transporter (OPT) family protein